jgi:hypothetical protein
MMAGIALPPPENEGVFVLTDEEPGAPLKVAGPAEGNVCLVVDANLLVEGVPALPV